MGNIDYVKMESHRRLLAAMHHFYVQQVDRQTDVSNPYDFMDKLAFYLVTELPVLRDIAEQTSLSTMLSRLELLVRDWDAYAPDQLHILKDILKKEENK